MKKMNFQNIKNVLSRDEMKKIMAGSGGGCIADGQDCGLFKACCHVCRPTFKCGQA